MMLPEKKGKKSPAVEIQCDPNMNIVKSESQTDPNFSNTVVVEKNHSNFKKLAKAAIKLEISNLVTAALATAVLIDYGAVKESNKSQVIT